MEHGDAAPPLAPQPRRPAFDALALDDPYRKVLAAWWAAHEAWRAAFPTMELDDLKTEKPKNQHPSELRTAPGFAATPVRRKNAVGVAHSRRNPLASAVASKLWVGAPLVLSPTRVSSVLLLSI